MARRTIRQTLDALPDTPDKPDGRPTYSASARREQAARSIERKYGRALDALAKLAFESADPSVRLSALTRLLPYLYPQLKAVEVSGPDGQGLVIEVRKASVPTECSHPAAPALDTPAESAELSSA